MTLCPTKSWHTSTLKNKPCTGLSFCSLCDATLEITQFCWIPVGRTMSPDRYAWKHQHGHLLAPEYGISDTRKTKTQEEMLCSEANNSIWAQCYWLLSCTFVVSSTSRCSLKKWIIRQIIRFCGNRPRKAVRGTDNMPLTTFNKETPWEVWIVVADKPALFKKPI